jgi:hypothetical protein
MKRLRCKDPIGQLCLNTLALFVTISVFYMFVQTGQAKRSGGTPQTFAHPVFRYAIIYNDRGMDGSSKDITILMDPSEFSEANLRILFILLSDRFKSIPSFNAYIETSLQDIDTPEQHEEPGYSEYKGPDNPKAGKTPYASIRHSPKSDTLYIFQPPRGAGNQRKIDLGGPRAN